MELFGSLSSMTQFIVVFVVILGVLIPLAWRFFGAGSTNFAPRGRRLTVIETAPVDLRHRVVLVKRDNVEHLLLIGGPSSVVIETGISRSASREPRPIPDARGEAVRAVDAGEWGLPEPVNRPLPVVDLDAALPEPPARTAREAMVDSMRAVRSGTAARRPPLSADIGDDAPLAPETRSEPARSEPARRPPEARPQAETPANDAAKRAAPPRNIPVPRQVQAVPPAAPAASDDGNFAEMAQRLEAALRRPKAGDKGGDKAAEAGPQRGREAAVPPPPPPPRRPAAAADAPRRAKSAETPPPDLKVLPGKGQNELAMENLEDEMAKMLGRPAKS